MTFSPGDRVRVDYETDDGQPTWYRAEVLGPSNQRGGDYFVRVIELGPHCAVSVGDRLSPILGDKIELVREP